MAKGMANGQPWYPANDVEAEKASRGEAYQGKDGEFYQHEDMPKASPKNPPAPAEPAAAEVAAETPAPHPHATPPATRESGPTAADLDAVAAEEAINLATSAPASTISAPAPKPTPGGPINPSYDADKYDSTGENLKQDGPLGPRGVNRPGDVMSDDERAQIAVKQEGKLRKGMSPTHSIDSVGKPKGSFKTVAQGHDKHGAKVPDKIDYTQPTEVHVPMVGPRGAGAPKDTFHKK